MTDELGAGRRRGGGWGVARPVQERFDPQIGRVILKYVSDDYLLNDKLTAADTTDL